MKTKLFKIVFFLIIINTLFVSSAFAVWVQPSSLNFGTYGTSLTVTLTSDYSWCDWYQRQWWMESKPSWVNGAAGWFFPDFNGNTRPAQVAVSVNRTGLTPGQTYSGTVRFYESGFSLYADLSVSMRVPLPPQLSVSPGSYNFGDSGTTCQFAVQNTGESTLNWSVSEGISWLSLSSSGGSVPPGGLQYVSAMVNRGTLTPGTYTGTISFTSDGGNKSVPVQMTVADTTPPTGIISINGGAAYTNSTSVTLTLSASDSSEVSKMRFSNDGANWSGEENYATSKSWTLTAGDGIKTVYVQYKDNANNWSTPLSISDTIILDSIPPTGIISINNGALYTDSTSVTLTLSASDSSGVSKMKFSNDGVVWSGEENYAISESWTLTVGDGTKTVYVQYKDNAGNWSVSISDTIVLDTTPPTGTISINSGVAYTDSTSVTLALPASDSSGISKMKFSNDGINWSSEESYAMSKTWTLTAGEGTKTVYVKYKDNAGNWSASISDTIVLDTIPPTGTISINGGAVYTDSTSVTLTLSASDSGSGVSKMKFSNDGVNWSSEEDYATSKSWTLAPGDEIKTVYVQYKDNAGRWSASINDTIVLDTTPPTGTISINSGDEYTSITSVTLTLSASDSGSGVSKMKFSNDGVNWSSEEDYATSKTWVLTATDGIKTVYVQYKDNAGRWSASINDTIILDTTPPTGTISINNGDVYTSITSVTLTLSASDSGSGVSKMKFSNDGANWSVEENYATSKTWTITTGDGTKTVYVQYKDSAGNWSASKSDTIILDATPPTGTISINNGDEYTGSTSVTLTLSASDSNGVSKMKFSNNGISWDPEEDYATSKSWTVTTGDGTKTVYVRYKDTAGNWSTPPLSISDTIIMDTTPPTGTISINGGAGYANSTSVTLTLSASDSGSGVSKMKFSNDGVNWSSEENYATGKTWVLTTGDEEKTVYVQYKDNAGKWSGSISDTIILETASPIGTISINNGAAYTNSASVTLTLSASDSNGVSKMMFSNDGANWSSEEDYATSKDWTLTPPGDGLKTVYVRYKDTTGNWSGLTSINDPIILDTTPSTGTTISINSGAVYTDSTSVTLTLSASDSSSGVSKMQFSNDGANWSSEEDYATSKSWTLTTGDGLNTIYVRYKDTAGNWSGSISDTIILDTTPPTGTISIKGGDVYANSTSVILTLSASDSTSGVSKMKFSNDGVSWSSEEDYATSKSWTLTPPGDGTKTVYVQYKDNVGSWSGLTSINDTIILDTTPSIGTISINSGAVYTDSTSVTLTLSASDSSSGVNKMKFSNDGANWSSEEDYATSKSWTLTAGDGTKTVYVQYKDNAGSWSVLTSISDTIILETEAPTGTISINGMDLYTSTTPVTLTLSASDPGSGVSKMKFSNDGVSWSSEEDYATSKSWTLTAGDGTKTVYVQYKDNAGSWSVSISDTIILDTTSPTGTILIKGMDVYTNSTSVILTLSASDSGSGVSKMKFSNDGVNWSVEEDTATSKSWTLVPDDGTKTVYVQYKDNAGNWSTPPLSISDTIIMDTQNPTVTLVVDNDKSTILPDGEIVGVLPDTGMEAKFSKVMDTESVKEGLKLIAVKDNLNETINEEVSLDFDWESSTKTVITPVLELKKNYLYSLKVTDTVTDLAGNTIEGEREIIFRTIMDYTKKNVVVKATDERLMVTLEANALAVTLEANALTVTLEANALPEDGYLIINTEPLTYQFKVNPEVINVANEKSIPNGWYPIEGCLWEIKVCKENGDWMEDKFGSEVKIIFPYDEGVVENALIPLMEKTLQAFWLNEEHSNWVRVPGSIVDRENNVVVTGEVPHFSVFGLMGSAVYDLSDAHAYPVPWKPNDGKDETGTEQQGITFTTLSSQGAIKIYSISGELVREYDYKPADGGKWTWDVKTSRGEKVFSGVYIYYIKNEKEQKKGRLMIIR